MAKYVFELDADLEAELAALFSRVGPGGYFIKHIVGFVDGKVRAEVRSNEHPPPHFHITYDGDDASFAILTGRRLSNVEGLERYDDAVYLWWKKHRLKIVEKWNSSRPGNCPVGPVEVPQGWT